MVVKLQYTNNLPMPIVLLNNMGTGQPLLAGQQLELMFDLLPDDDGVTELILIAQPGDAAT